MTSQPSAFLRIFRSSVLLGAGELGARALSFIAMVHLARRLLPDAMGFVEFGLSIFGLASVITLGGTELLAVRRAARSERGLRRLAGTVMLASWVYGAVAVVALGLLALLLPGSTGMPRPVVLFGFAALLLPLSLRFAFLGREEMGILAVGSLAAQLGFLVLCLGLVDEPSHWTRVAFIWLGAEAVRAVVQNVAFRRRHGPPVFTVRRSQLGVWVRSALPLTLGRVARGALFVADILILGLLASPAQVGLYGAALRIPQLVSTLAVLVHTAALPSTVRLATSGGAGFAAFHGELVRAALGVSVPLATALALTSEPLMLLLFGETFRASAPLLALLVWKAVLVGIGGLYRNVVLARRPALDARVAGLGTALGVGSILALVPVLGAAGAAVGILVGEGTLLFGYAWLARRWVGFAPGTRLGWVLRAGAGMALVVVVFWSTQAQPGGSRVAAMASAGIAGALIANADLLLRLLRERHRA